MRQYYIAYLVKNNYKWVIRNTKNNLNTGNGLFEEICKIQSEENNDSVIIFYFKKLRWWNRLTTYAKN